MKAATHLRRPTIITVVSLLAALVLTVLPLGMAHLSANPGWDQQNPGVSGSWRWTSCVNPRTVWVDGIGVALRSTDGGATWESHVPVTPDHTQLQLGPISAIDANTAWAAGTTPTSGYMQIYKTTDGGKTWTQQFSYPQSGFFDIAAVDANNIWAVGYIYNGPTNQFLQNSYTNVIIKSSDGGATWSPKFSWPYTFVGPINQSLYPCDANTLWTWGVANNSQGAIWKTVDGGASWNPASLPSGVFGGGATGIAVRGVDANTAWMTDVSSVYKTTDGGATWEKKFTFDPPPTYALPTMATFGTGIAWIGLSGGRIIRTIDGGANWSLQPFPGTDSLSVVISACDPNNAWAAATTDANGVSNCYIYHTSNGGGQPVALPPAVTVISPASGVNNANYAVAITGSGFATGATARLQSGATAIDGVGVTVTGPTRLTCYFDLTNKPPGKYDVIVKNPSGQEGKLTGGFSVTNICGQGAGASISVFIGLMGLLSITGLGLSQRRRCVQAHNLAGWRGSHKE
jgi:photosystem II stability/assembly factor-like uncharacterized protein